ncbi:kinase [Corynebacterium sp. 13CS0277]|uniref:DAK2 domain-containing protein n=1 Tax=Corynebacterium sp. 13CS0277 TaxID=2071994 RepID=UPI000D03E028|nr:DAK2 domain-containing protein [Corynebacterium sp. 13CS0277]PRQ11209.1 kinase [Corynebacterium sp. 13CS0277]
MSLPVELDGRTLYSWAERAVDALRARRADINALNVFPVPDSDTGSNMAYTMESALAEAGQYAAGNPSARQVAEALARGAVRGARGNSGVVLSQVLRGLAEAAATGPVDAHAIAAALTRASRMVDEAITQPVEGTVITVLRATATAANHALDTAPDMPLVDVVRAATRQAREALALTPSQLPTLRAAGVVDAGGQGFVFLMDALLDTVTGAPQPTRHALTQPADAAATQGEGSQADATHPERPEAHTDISATGGAAATVSGMHHAAVAGEHQLEIMCYLEDADIPAVRTALGVLGDSLIVAPAGDTASTIHIHVAPHHAGDTIAALYRMGTVSDLRIEILPPAPIIAGPTRLIVAVVPTGPLAELYQQAHATTIGADDIVADFSHAIHSHGAQEIILLPNGHATRTHMVSAELTAHATGKHLAIVHTEHLLAGLAALAVHDPTQPLAVDTFAMSEAASAVRTADITPATHAGLSTHAAWAAGDYIATSSSRVLAAADTAHDCLLAAACTMLASGGEMLTVLHRHTDPIDPHTLAARIEDTCGRPIDVVCYPADGITARMSIGVE